jgi:MFS family permease
MPNSETLTVSAPETLPPSHSLWHDSAFWGMAVAQFFGAFNDNVCKQLAMLICLQETLEDKQASATAVFAIPFLLFSGTAGFLADRISKSWIVQACKVAEVGIQATALLLAVSVGMSGGSLTTVMLTVLFLMGIHSAFFGPSKYGVLPEMLPKEALPKANGVFLATTFLAIILGWVVAGALMDVPGSLPFRTAVACTAGVGFALIGWWASLYLRPTPPAQPALKFSPKQFAVDPATWKVVGKDRLLLGVLVANGTFFLCGGAMHPAVNAFGIQQLKASSSIASGLLSCVAFGIAGGCAIAGRWCGARANLNVSKIGAATIVACLGFLYLTPTAPGSQNLWVAISAVLFLGVGLGAGLLAVPLQVVLQTRPPAEHRGRVLAALSFFNWIGVLISAAYYKLCLVIRDQFDLPPSFVFAAIAIVMLGVAVMLPSHVVEREESLDYSREMVIES